MISFDKLWQLILSLPKSLWVNFRYLPLKQAMKLPLFVSYNAEFQVVMGGVILPNTTHFAMVRIGFHKVPARDMSDETRIVIRKGGVLHFEGTAHIGNGSKLFVGRNAKMTLGDNFAISASSAILCYKKISFGRDIQFSWDCLVMDSDTHTIYDKDGSVINAPREIVIGNKVWIGTRCTILKGTVIPDNTVIGACSLVSGNKFSPDTIIAGSPAKSVKVIGGFSI